MRGRSEGEIAASLRSSREGLRVLTLLLGSSLTVMSGAAVSPALPSIAGAFDDVPRHELLVQLILTMPALFIVFGAPVAGVLCDRWGRRPVLLWGILVYGVAGTSGFVLTDLYAILAGRAVLGLAVAGVITSCSTLIGDYFVGHDRERVMGQQVAFMAFGGVVLPVMSGFLALVSWHHPFLVYATAFLVFPLVLLTIYEPERGQSTTDDADADGEKLDVGRVALIYALAVMTMTAFYLLPVQLPFYLKELTGATAREAGFALAGVSACSGIASLLFRRIKRRFSSPGLIALTFSLIGVGYVLIAYADGYALIVAGMVLGGFGLGWTNPNLSLWLINSVPERVRGRIVGGMAMSYFLGQFLSPIVARPFVIAGGYALAYLAIAGVLIAIAAGFAVNELRAISRRPGRRPSV